MSRLFENRPPRGVVSAKSIAMRAVAVAVPKIPATGPTAVAVAIPIVTADDRADVVLAVHGGRGVPVTVAIAGAAGIGRHWFGSVRRPNPDVETAAPAASQHQRDDNETRTNDCPAASIQNAPPVPIPV